MKDRVCIYHANCLDGFTAAWCVWRKYGDTDTEYVAANHGDAPPDVSGRECLIVDFSYPRDVMVAMADSARALLVLDHHKTAQAALEGLPFAVFDMSRSGAGLAWDYAFAGESRPWLVDYVEDRDLWRFALPSSKEINAGISGVDRNSFGAWDCLLEVGREYTRRDGAAILGFVDRYVREMAAQARVVNFAGHAIPMVNAPYINTSELVGHLAESAPFAVGWYQDGTGTYRYSLRSRGSDGVDVSEIAKRFGGGGHRNAAGFAVKERPMELA